MSTTITIALGSTYEKEARLLSRHIPNLLIITDTHSLYAERVADDPMVNALATKAGFGTFLPDDGEGAVFLCDTDLHPVNEGNPFDLFSNMGDADIAFVPYPSKFFFPASESYQEAGYIALGCKLNSGLLWFKDHTTARAISTAWEAKYLEDVAVGGAMADVDHKNDEFSLMAVLAAGDWRFRVLEQRWNNQWQPQDDDIIRHGHVDVEIIEMPTVARKIAKFDLIEKLIALDVVEEFYAIINALPLAERLKWDAAQNVSEDYPFLVENKDLILGTLGITEEQFDDLFL
jgi:hypothetical protein